MDLNRLFAALNTTGIQLEPVDLLKSKLFKKITSKKDLYSAIWQACEHTDDYFERNLRQLFITAEWNRIEYSDLIRYDPSHFELEDRSSNDKLMGKTVKELAAEVF